MKKAFFLVCTVLCANLLVSQTFTSEGLNYEVIDDNSVRLADNNEASGEIVIPSAVIYSQPCFVFFYQLKDFLVCYGIYVAYYQELFFVFYQLSYIFSE